MMALNRTDEYIKNNACDHPSYPVQYIQFSHINIQIKSNQSRESINQSIKQPFFLPAKDACIRSRNTNNDTRRK